MVEPIHGTRPHHPFLRRLKRKNVLSGLMFIAVGCLGLWLSREYPVGTLRRMGTGFMPQALCWLLAGLGGVVLVQGLLESAQLDSVATAAGQDAPQEERENHWAILIVAASLVAFALSIEWLGLVIAVGLLIVIASLAYRGLKWWETLATALVLAGLCWAIFILGLGTTMRVWPEL